MAKIMKRTPLSLPNVAPAIPPHILQPGPKMSQNLKDWNPPHQRVLNNGAKIPEPLHKEFMMANMDQGWAMRFISGNKEKEYHARIAWLLNDAGHQALKYTFDSIHPPLTLKDRLAQAHVKAVLQRLHEQGLLNEKQWKLLYPPKKNNILSQHYDTRTLITLLQNVCHLCPPYPNGWTALPLSTDSSLSADIVRLQLLHQRVASIETITIDEYNTIWKQCVEVLVRLGGPPMRMKINRIEHENIQAEMQNHHLETIQENWGGSKRLVASPMSSASRKKGRVKRSRDKNSDRMGLPPEERVAMMKTWKMFVDNVQAEDIIDRLQQNQVLKFSDRQDIFNISKNTERMQHLMDKILNSNLPYGFKALCDSIKFKYKRLYEEVMAIRKDVYKNGVKVSVGFENRDDKRRGGSNVIAICQEALVSKYTAMFSKCQPFPWNDTIQANIRDLYNTLDILDIEGKKVALCDILPAPSTNGKGHRMLLEGASGSGKTMLSNTMAYLWAAQSNYFKNPCPLLLHIDLKSVLSNFDDEVYRNLFPDNFKIDKEEFWHLLEGRAEDVVLIIDGYESGKEFQSLLDILNGRKLQQSTVIVTADHEQCPNLGFQPDLKFFIMGYSMKNVLRCMKTYIRLFGSEPENHPKLFDALEDESFGLSLYITNPFICLLTFGVYQTMKHINLREITTVANLFETYGIAMASLYCKRQKIDVIGMEFPEDVMDAIEQLTIFAFTSLMDDNGCFTEEEILNETKSQIVFKLGVFQKFTEGTKWRYVCNLMQQFLAAKHLADFVLDDIMKLMKEHAMTKHPKYNQAVSFLCGLYRNDFDTPVLSSLFTELAVKNVRHTKVSIQEVKPDGMVETEKRKPRPPSGQILDFGQSLQSLAECYNRDDAFEIISRSLPARLVLRRDGIISSKCIYALQQVLHFPENRIAHLELHVLPLYLYQQEMYIGLAKAASKSKAIKSLKLNSHSLELSSKFLNSFLEEVESVESIIVDNLGKKNPRHISASTWATLQNACQNMGKTNHFSFRNCKEAATVYFVIHHLPNTIQELNFSGCTMNMMCAGEISIHLEHAQCLQKLDITNCHLVGSDIVAIMQGLKLCSTIKSLKLCGAKLDRPATTALGECLRLTRTLSTLDLSHCELSTEMIEKLVSAIVENRSLKRLLLNSTRVSEEGFAAISRSNVEENVQIEGLDDWTYALYT